MVPLLVEKAADPHDRRPQTLKGIRKFQFWGT